MDIPPPSDIPAWALLVCMTAFLVAGFVDAIAGGGGLITTPILLLVGLPPHVALGTGKFSVTIGGLTALATYLGSRLVVMRVAPVGFAAAAAGSVLGARMALLLDAAVLGKVIVLMLPIGLVVSLLAGKGRRQTSDLPERHLHPKVAIIGLVIGAYDGFFGPGTGSFLIIALNLLLGMDLIRASATAKVLNLASNIGAFCAFATGGVVAYAVAIPCACASVCGNVMGARMAIRVGTEAVRRLLYVMLLLLLTTLVQRFILS